MKCPSCGAEASGKFCSSCGAALAKRACAKCGETLSAGAKFCHVCGARVGAAGGVPAPSSAPWFIAGGAVVVLVVVLAVTQFRPAATPPPASVAPAGAGGPVDLSQMTPRQAADRLFDRVMMARETGKADTAAFFAPMALQAYSMLDELDADARFHVGLLQVAAGDPAAADAQADTLARTVPTHLYASMLRAEAARVRGDSAAARRADAEYLRNYDAETAAARPEYGPHASWLATYRDSIRR
jgi:hypothetical protein